MIDNKIYMKNILMLVAIALIATMTACSDSESVRLVGNIENAEDETIILQQINLSSTEIVDSAKISSDGSFKLRAPRVSEPTFFKAYLHNGKSISFIADSTETIEVKADNAAANWYTSITFTDSPVSTDLQTIITKGMTLQSELAAYSNSDMTGLSLNERETRSAEATKVLNEYKSFVHHYIFEHPRSFVSYYALFQTVLNLNVFDVMGPNDHTLFATVATGLNLLYPDNERVRHLCDYVLQARAIQKRQKRNSELINSANEVKSPDLSMPDRTGNDLRLSDLRGNVVILQYWLSTDKSSRNLNKQLVKLYNKYHQRGLEIYQVSLDQSKVLWESAIDNDGLTWANVCDLQGSNSIGARLYNVSQVPSNFIIDRDGAIIGKDLFSTRLDEKMADLFQ